MKTPLKIYQERKERKNLESEIRENSRIYELTLNDIQRKRLIYLHRQHEIKFGRCYKG